MTQDIALVVEVVQFLEHFLQHILAAFLDTLCATHRGDSTCTGGSFTRLDLIVAKASLNKNSWREREVIDILFFCEG